MVGLLGLCHMGAAHNGVVELLGPRVYICSVKTSYNWEGPILAP